MHTAAEFMEVISNLKKIDQPSHIVITLRLKGVDKFKQPKETTFTVVELIAFEKKT